MNKDSTGTASFVSANATQIKNVQQRLQLQTFLQELNIGIMSRVLASAQCQMQHKLMKIVANGLIVRRATGSLCLWIVVLANTGINKLIYVYFFNKIVQRRIHLTRQMVSARATAISQALHLRS